MWNESFANELSYFSNHIVLCRNCWWFITEFTLNSIWTFFVIRKSLCMKQFYVRVVHEWFIQFEPVIFYVILKEVFSRIVERLKQVINFHYNEISKISAVVRERFIVKCIPLSKFKNENYKTMFVKSVVRSMTRWQIRFRMICSRVVCKSIHCREIVRERFIFKIFKWKV